MRLPVRHRPIVMAVGVGAARAGPPCRCRRRRRPGRPPRPPREWGSRRRRPLRSAPGPMAAVVLARRARCLLRPSCHPSSECRASARRAGATSADVQARDPSTRRRGRNRAEFSVSARWECWGVKLGSHMGAFVMALFVVIVTDGDSLRAEKALGPGGCKSSPLVVAAPPSRAPVGRPTAAARPATRRPARRAPGTASRACRSAASKRRPHSACLGAAQIRSRGGSSNQHRDEFGGKRPSVDRAAPERSPGDAGAESPDAQISMTARGRVACSAGEGRSLPAPSDKIRATRCTLGAVQVALFGFATTPSKGDRFHLVGPVLRFLVHSKTLEQHMDMVTRDAHTHCTTRGLKGARLVLRAQLPNG